MTRREKLQELLVKQPDDAFLHYGLAIELVKEGEAEAALERFDRVLRLDAGYSAAHYQKANTCVALGRLEEARATLVTGIAAARAKGDAHAEEEMRSFLGSLG
ncbi:MAG: tetratricopeptide repeat protein [Planctomycetota bacterium]